MFQAIISFLSEFAFVAILHVMGGNSFPKPLSRKEEEKQIELLKKGDKNARNTLIEHNLRLVAHIVKKYHSASGDQDDLVSIGTIGLIKAVDTFNADKNIKLSSYASRCIENEILMYLRSTKKQSLDISLDESIDSDKDGNPLTLMDIMSTDDNIFDELYLKMNSEKVCEYVSRLPQRERDIIIMRYGLDGNEPLTQRDTAAKLNISRSYVSRIEKRAIAALSREFGDN
ncbi:MAG: RNA polymerase sporulation sigma factor SigK [Clostridia bacterium]|nr:RNA polymerase sporulation sigma factor SigK [Clostridia bacterium]